MDLSTRALMELPHNEKMADLVWAIRQVRFVRKEKRVRRLPQAYTLRYTGIHLGG